jgi:NAD(P)H-dependent FMN reductase
MPNILAITGSIRTGSFNQMLTRAAVAHAPAGLAIETASIQDIPLYDGDHEAASGLPPAVQGLKARIVAAHGVLLITPEYNNSIPGTFKNAIDWTSRPPADLARVYGGKPIGVIGATPGPGGTAMSQAAWLPVLRALGTIPFFGARLQVPHASKVFDATGALIDDAVRGQLERYLTAFSDFVSRLTRA